MASFSKYETVDVCINVSAQEFYSAMDDSEKTEMLSFLVKDTDYISSIDIIHPTDKNQFYKELAYYVGNSDSENLEYLIEELKYWSKK